MSSFYCCGKEFKTKRTFRKHELHYCKMNEAYVKRTLEQTSLDTFVDVLVNDMKIYQIQRTSNADALIIQKFKDSELPAIDIRSAIERRLERSSRQMQQMATKVDELLEDVPEPEYLNELQNDINEMQHKSIAFLDKEILFTEIILTEMKRIRLSLDPEMVALTKLCDIAQEEAIRQLKAPVTKRTKK